MTDRPTTLRLDEILLFDGLVTEDQIRDALAQQREHGGRIGSHLMRSGVVSESGLVGALAKQCDADGVVISEIAIPPEVLKFIPSEVALARRVIPFDYNPDNNILKVACEDPRDKDLVNELNFVARGKDVRLYVAAELSLKAAIARYYLTGINGHSNQLTESGSLPIADTILAENNRRAVIETSGERGRVLLVTDESAEGTRIRALLEQQNYAVVVLDSADDAIDLIGTERFDTVFIKDTVPGDYIDLIDRLRKTSPKTNVRYFESAARLMLDREAASVETDLLLRNLELFTSLLASQSESESNHSATVGHHVDRLCNHLGIPDKERLLIVTAAYLHDLSKYYYGAKDLPEDPRAQIDLTIKLLDSLAYSPVVIEILRSTYINLRGKYTKRLPIEVLGGNIVTIVDIFCDNITVNEKISLDKFEAIRKKFDELTGKLFLEEVVNAFIDMIQAEVLKTQKEVKFGRVMIFGENKKDLARVQRHLQAEGFRAMGQHEYSEFVDLYTRGTPNMIILMASGEPVRMMSMIEDLMMRGVDIPGLPTFILADARTAPSLTSMFDRGVEDIIVLDESLEMLVVKLKKVRDRLEEQSEGPKGNGVGSSRGSLADMNLIDLLQAMGPSRKTAKLVLTSAHKETLTMYLQQGNIMFAECKGKVGPEAVYQGITWSQGEWTMQPVKESELPEPNNDLPNESILMEGCRLLDESSRTDKIPTK